MSTMREALSSAMHTTSPDDALSSLHGQGVAVATQDTMSQAIHDVYCGIMADHQHPNEKDQEQARQILVALGRLSQA
jgi:hypothetical protein